VSVADLKSAGKKWRQFAAVLLVAVLVTAAGVNADERENEPAANDASRARFSEFEGSGSLKRIHLAPLALQGGTTLTLISPERWSKLADKLAATLSATHRHFTDLFGRIPAFMTTVRLTDDETFYLTTGAPRWTNAMYFKGQILIPLVTEEEIDFNSIERAVKHEFTHAVVHALSSGRCPGWLDEGLAQWAEGNENPALRPALVMWLNRHPPVALSLLQGGFTRLDAHMVPAAYAQSLFAANVMVNTFGFGKLRGYLDALHDGGEKEPAFEKNFGLSERNFEKSLALTLYKWADEVQVSADS
jgi:hypothetical protein